MGSIVYRATKDQAIHDELASVGAYATVLAPRAIGNRLWFLAQHRAGERTGCKWIGLTLIESRKGEVAVKSMDETCGPCYYDCPLSFLAQADAPTGPYAGPWRERVRAFHASRSARRAAIRPGVRISYDAQVYVLQHCLGRRGWDVARESDGQAFRMKSRQLGSATLLPTSGVTRMNIDFERHETVPAYTRNLTSKDRIKWSGEFEVPVIGADILIRFDGIGRAKVVGYATHGGYLGVMSVPCTPPDWWIRQNGPPTPDNAALAFGAEIALLSSAEAP
ncbi:hypothetical protein [Variovorax atrisoli]|uniref:hypothetical protein n=1 Tax=Variovorax atrisoli TaxID=3394203 RepID=UPI001F0CD203|nr:hypothetical protein [Variovorax sp. 369]